MRLKTLELQGYKSFATKTVFQFDAGITAVVGPNGSGKSNIADAVRWVLGEQSYSVLRGRKTEDMIFSGSDGRPRLGMAQVTLVLDNQDHWLPIEFTEVTITRRAYRDGQNDYLLNGSRVRLRDVNELLAAGGLARHAYTLVGQGLVDAALSLRAEERRLLFEEAAGIALHQARRVDALNKLDATQANLVRLRDILSEIEPRLSYLEKQAERAITHQTISAHLQSLLRTWYGFKWGEGQERLRLARMNLERSQQALAAQQAGLESLGQRIAELRARQGALRAKLGEWHRLSSQLHDQAEALQRDLAVAEERARLLAAQRDELLSELEPLRAARQLAETRAAEAQRTLTELEQELAVAQRQVAELQGQLGAHQAQRQAILDQQARSEQHARQLADQIAGGQARLLQMEEQRTRLQRTAEETQRAVAALQEKRTTLHQQLLAKQEALQQITAGLRELEAQRAQELAAIKALGSQAASLGEDIHTQRRQLEVLRARQDMLTRMQRDLVGYYEGVRAVLKAGSEAGGLQGIIGSVAQLLRVPAGLEAAIETALGGHVQDVVVATWSDAEAAIAYLKAHHAGRATFLPLDTIRPPEPLRVPANPRVLGLAMELVEYDARLARVAQLLLGRTLVVEDLPTARQVLSALSGSFQIVTRGGDLVRSGGSVSGGSVSRDKAGAGFLARQREWQELPALLAEQEGRLSALQTRLEENQRAQASHQATAEELARRQASLQAGRANLEREQASLTRELERTDQAIQWQQESLDRTLGERSRLEADQQRTQAEIERLQAELSAAQTQAAQLAAQAAALSAEALLTRLGQAQTGLASAEGRVLGQRNVLEGQRSNLADLSQRLQTRQQRADQLGQEREALLSWLAEQRARSEQINVQLAELAACIQPAEAELTELEQRQSQLEAEEGHQRQVIHRLETEHSRYGLEYSRCQDDMDRLRRQIEDELGLVEVELSEDVAGQPPLPLHPLISQLPVVKELPEDLEPEIRRLRGQLNRLGSVNPNAPQEFEEVRNRHTFLAQQISDLEKAAADLRQIIAELDRVMEHDFLTTFESVAQQFQVYFKRLFNGGEARLVLTDPNNLTQTGVDIIARPPGKRAQNLSMLSGGERALTAVALIFALLKISPTPFCILDEVDAMLDEANVGRFRQTLEELARDIQFIVITHNRRTIEAASTIYGVSMGADSVSRVISLKLDQVVTS